MSLIFCVFWQQLGVENLNWTIATLFEYLMLCFICSLQFQNFGFLEILSKRGEESKFSWKSEFSASQVGLVFSWFCSFQNCGGSLKFFEIGGKQLKFSYKCELLSLLLLFFSSGS